MTWIPKRDVSDAELRGKLAMPRMEADALCPNMLAREGGRIRCEARLSDVKGIEGGPVCLACGTQFERGSAAVQ